MLENTINDDKTIAGGIGTMLAGRYHILRQLGEGGMGSVWLAEDRQLDNRKVAIKMLPSIVVTDKRAYKQLKSEALVSLKLVHPNIVTLRAFEENNGAPYLVMDYIEGQTLSDYLAVKGKLSEAETIKLLKPIAAALDYAHGEKVIHRDVKPSNIIIRKDGHPFILDFGIAREIQESMTRVTGRTISGTLLYMSPEQLRGAPPAPAQDVYSFAAMVYECLNGAPPFTSGEIAYQILNEKPLPLSGGMCFVTSIMVGLAKKPEGRPRNCMMVFGEECRLRRHGSAEVWQSTELERVDRWLKKVILGIVVIAVVAIIIWGISAYDKKQSTKQFLALMEAKSYDAAARLIDNIDVSDAHVQFFLGEMYYNGNGVAKDDEIAVGWYRKAAKQGSLDAEFNLRHYLFSTREMPKRRSSLSEITWHFFVDEYYKHSIEERQKEHQKQGKVGLNMPDWAASHIGGGLFLKEIAKDEFEEDDSATKVFSEINDVLKKKDYVLAAKLLGDFSYADDTACQFFNGVLAECRNDIKAAHRWYQLAAEEWCKEALFNLGVFYEFGVGVQRDSKLAAGYYQRSAIQGDKEALQRWQRLSDSNVTVPDLNLAPIFDRKPWPDSSVLVKGAEFAALRDDVGRWWDVPFSKVKEFFKVNANQVDGKFFFVEDSNDGKTINHYEIRRDRIQDFDTENRFQAVERWNGEEMQFLKANDVQSARNMVLYYILITGKDEFAKMNSGKKFEAVAPNDIFISDDGVGIMTLWLTAGN